MALVCLCNLISRYVVSNLRIQDSSTCLSLFYIAQGVLQPDMWGVTPSKRWDWVALREMISENGVRNSLLVAPMPTASTSQILGNNECFEPYTSNINSRRVLRFAFSPYLILSWSIIVARSYFN